MRADRLISILMLLQARGLCSAPELARELEVSERTIYRDIDHLSSAGVPIYAQPGLHGGFALLENYRTNLTGLTSGELRALFAISLPQPFEDLGIIDQHRSALRKLQAAHLASTHPPGQLNQPRLHIDPTSWQGARPQQPHLQTIYQAVMEDRRLILTRLLFSGTPIELKVDPCGLVIKAGEWHLVLWLQGRIQVIEFQNIISATLTEERFQRPTNFDLASFWQAWCARQHAERCSYLVKLRVAPDFVHAITWHFGAAGKAALKSAAAADDLGWISIELAFESHDAARRAILACGGGVEVLSPQPLRRSVLDFAEQILRRYAAG